MEAGIMYHKEGIMVDPVTVGQMDETHDIAITNIKAVVNPDKHGINKEWREKKGQRCVDSCFGISEVLVL